MNNANAIVELRVAARPYCVYTIIASPVVIACIYDAFNAPSEAARVSNFQAVALIFFLLGCLFFPLWMYRIKLYKDELVDYGFLKFTKRAPVISVSKVRQESGWPKQRWYWAPAMRPFRRIAVYFEDGEKTESLDISLNHFPIAKVRELLDQLQQLRPDLDVPLLIQRKRAREHSERRSKRKLG